MVTVAEVLSALELLAPTRATFSFDRVGLQVGDPATRVTRAVVCLDRSREAVAFAAERSAQLIVSHHPLIFEPLKTLDARDPVGGTAWLLARHGISLIAAHTNWDAARPGLNDALAAVLGLRDVTRFGSSADVPYLKLTVTVPRGEVEKLMDALAGAGAGTIGDYDRCAFLIDGTGTFRPGEGANPAIGSLGEIETVSETRIDTVLPAERAPAVVRALRGAHPYEEPAYDLTPIRSLERFEVGRVGSWGPGGLGELVEAIDGALGTRCLAWGSPGRSIGRVAVVGGAADGEWRAAQAAGADVLVTGEVKQHVALEAVEAGFALVQAGHYATEQPGMVALAEALRKRFPQVEWDVFVPEPGSAGRPLQKKW